MRKNAMADPLAGVESVPWSNLRHAHGDATDVPRLLKALLSKQEAERKDAWHELYGTQSREITITAGETQIVNFLFYAKP